MMRYLLIDNSNTRTKLRFADDSGLQEWKTWISTAEVREETLDRALRGQTFDAVLLCSVVPQKAEIIRHYFRDHAFHQSGYESRMPLSIDYPHPHQIGADRLANAVGVVACYQAPAIVIDFGTAVTFDVISATPAYCGGVIAPGLGSMNDYLHRKTALLPLIELREPTHAIGKSTEEAMRSGAVLGYRGLVKEILHSLKKEMEGEPLVIATGGDARLIAAGVPEISIVDPQVTLKGLHWLAVNHFSDLGRGKS